MEGKLNNDILAIYYDNREFLELKEVENVDKQSVKQLPTVFFLKEEGFYNYENKVYRIQQEGLYRFVNNKGEKCQYYFYKENVERLVASLFWCINFSGKEEPLGHYDILNYFLQKDNIINLPIIKTVCNILKQKAVPWRQGYIVSVSNKEAIDSFLELWDFSKQSWVLFLLNDYTCLGNTSVDRTYIEAISEFYKENNKFAVIIPNVEIRYNFFSEKEVIKKMETNFANRDEKIKSFLQKKGFPVMKKSFASTRAFTSKVYEGNILDFIEEKKYYVFLDGKEDLHYEVNFLYNDKLRQEFYSKKLYVFKGKTVKTK